MKITYMGREYEEVDGKIYCDGEQISVMGTEVKSVSEISALLVDKEIYYQGQFYSKYV